MVVGAAHTSAEVAAVAALCVPSGQLVHAAAAPHWQRMCQFRSCHTFSLQSLAQLPLTQSSRVIH